MQVLEEFWASRRATDASSATHFVVGNEAADLDSIACAIAFAFFERDQTWVPVVQARRDDLRLRRENLAVLERCGIEASSLCCLDELPTMSRDKHVVLVDHNQATKYFQQATIDRIFDHHKDEHQHLNARRVIYSPDDAGSCASVLTMHWRPDDVPTFVADLLYMAILLDTVNFNRRAGKAQTLDYDAQRCLAPHLSFPIEHQDALFHDLQRMKNDTSHLSTTDHLRRDYKQMTCAAAHGGCWTIGMASVTLPLRALTEAGGFYDDALAFAEEHQVDVLMVLAGYQDEQAAWRRELMLLASEANAKRGVQDLAERLSSLQSHMVDLEPLDSVAHDARADQKRDAYFAVAWNQKDLRATRKQFVPAIQEVCRHVARS